MTNNSYAKWQTRNEKHAKNNLAPLFESLRLCVKLSFAVCRCILLSGLAVSLFPITGPAQIRSTDGPPLLTYGDLVALYENDVPAPDLQNRLTKLLNTPFVNNSAGGPAGPSSTRNAIRVATWNVERGLEFDAVKAALTNDARYFRRLPSSMRSSNLNLPVVLEQSSKLSQADVVVLNEVDWGLKRTNYRNVARELATAMHMNYAYAVEFVEVDPLTLGTETLEGETSADKAEIVKNIKIDKSRTLGLHGTAILSRFQLRNVRVVRFEHQGHDWYADEKKDVSRLEQTKQKGAGLVFSEKILREVRRGNRMMLLADIESAQLPSGALTVVATHLEAKSKPDDRRKQLEEILTEVKTIRHPVVIAGDMNTSGTDAVPTSFEREVKKRFGSSSFWVKKGIKYATGAGLLYDVTLGLVKAQRTKHDPTVKSIKFVSENPEERFFTALKDFRFQDGGAFDFRGSKQFSVGGSEETLSNSNERASKGFVSTLELRGKVTIELKLDWIFVKPAQLTDPDDTKQPYIMAPRFGRTLKTLNYSLKDRISDHNPLIADLRF
jgi:endonuclease/exonuclease/phosphatase family metal-dependent hydrolase